jgi:FKBP-type peptidyl-prolyl cis-trans isomerase
MKIKVGMTAAAAATIALALSACGGSSTTTAPGVSTAPSGGATVETAPATTPTTAATSTATTPSVATPTSGALSKEPVFKVPSGPAPKKLVVKDLIKGSGATLKKGDTVSVSYVGKLYSNGKVFDSSWKDEPGKTFSLTVGVGSVIKGWDQGLIGMKVGGRRELIIPPSLGYGAAGSPPTIPKNATLVFVVDLVKITGS